MPHPTPTKRRENIREENPVVIYFYLMYVIFGSSTTWDRSTIHPKFYQTGVQTHDLHAYNDSTFHVTENPALSTISDLKTAKITTKNQCLCNLIFFSVIREVLHK